jgi:Flp pilus assembly protein TadD
MIIKRGRLQQAEAAYRQVLAVEPAHAEALHLLGAIAHRAGRNDLAIHYIRQAVGLDDARPNYYKASLLSCAISVVTRRPKRA